MRSVLVVGAGMAGAVHARELADAGYPVHVIDKREHIAGNCYDSVTKEGVRVHRYGPHLFHTSNQKVYDWLSRFTDWVPYEHKVKAKLHDGRLLPMPVNLETINSIFNQNIRDQDEARRFVADLAEPRNEIRSAEDWLFANIGRKLTELFFRPYTEKMWNLKLADVDASTVKRVQLRYDYEDRYFPSETIQAMPQNGFTAMFERMLDHPLISVDLGLAFDKAMLLEHHHCFNSMPIDEYFDFSLGSLPYRSIRFHNEIVPLDKAERHVVINYTGDSRFTRETWWHLIPGHLVAPSQNVVRTIEEPCDYRDNAFERYYPVKTGDGRFDRLYHRYKELAGQEPNINFIGRCGTYQYLDMHQVVNQSLMSAERWLEEQLPASLVE